MGLDKIHLGRVFTHLEALLAEVELAVSGGDDDFAGALRQVYEDRVYRSIALRRFRSPVLNCPTAAGLRRRLKSLTASAGQRRPDLEPYLQNVEWFNGSYRADWDDHCYFIVPVMAIKGEGKKGGGQAEQAEAGFVYLRSTPKMSFSSKLNVEELTCDPNLLHYFEDIAAELLNTLYYVNNPYDVYEKLTARAYRLYFDCQITEGKSFGAALLVKFAISFIQAWLGERYKGVIAPQCGTVITGEIQVGGAVSKVSDVEDKIRGAVEEFGRGIKVILPAEQRLSEELFSQIDSVHYVSNVEELLAAALTSERDIFRGLMQARGALFRELDRPTKDKLECYLRPGFDRGIYDHPPGGWLDPLSHEGGVYSACRAGRDRLDVKLGLEQSALQDGAGAADKNEVVQIVIDGSEAMNEFWAKGPKERVSRVTSVLFEIARRIDPDCQKLLCGFLSHAGFNRVERKTDPEELEKFLLHCRASHKLTHRGSFFRPVYETANRDHRGTLNRVFVVSNSYVPDLIDFERNFSQFTLLRLTPDGYDITADLKDADEPVRVDSEVLYPDGTLDYDLLDRYFDRSHGTFKRIEVNLGEEPPVQWVPERGVVSQTADGYVYTLTEINELKLETRFRFPHQYPRGIKVSGELARSKSRVSFSFKLYPTPSMIAPLETNEYGKLTDADFALWQIICSPDEPCPDPDCGEYRVHLLHDKESDMQIKPRRVFASVEHLGNGYLLLREGSPDWEFFTTGCQIDGLCLLVLDGALYSSRNKGHVREVPHEGGLYSLRTGVGMLYMCLI